MPHIRLRKENTARRKNFDRNLMRIPILSRLHDYLYQKHNWYKHWHHHPLRPHVHRSILGSFLSFFVFFLVTHFLLPGTAFAATIVWDGGGTDILCGAGNENNWSCGYNWVGDVAPTAADRVIFDGTSSKDAYIDAGFTNSIVGLSVQSLYTGTIYLTQNMLLTTGSNGFSQQGGTFVALTNTQMDVNGNFTITGGTHVGATTLLLERAFTITVGTYTPSSDIYFDGSNVASNGVNVNGSMTLNNITVERTGTGGGLDITANNTLIVNGTLNLNDGDLGGSGANAQIVALAGVTFDETFSGGNALLTVSGTVPRTITLPSGVIVPKLQISDSNITLETSGTGHVTFDDTFNLYQGTFNVGTVSTTFEGSVDIENGSLNLGPETAEFLDDFFLTNGSVTANGGTFTMVPGTFLQLDGGDGSFDASTLTQMLISNYYQTNGSFTAPTGTLSIDTSFESSGGYFGHSSGTVAFVGENEQILGSTTFYNFIKESTAPGLEFILAAGSTTTVINNMEVKGFSSLNKLVFRSSVTSSPAYIDPLNNRTFEILSVRSISNVSTTELAECFVACSNLGSNTNWDFNPPPLITEAIFSDSLSSTSSDTIINITEGTTTTYYLYGSYNDGSSCDTVSSSTAKLFFSPDHNSSTCMASSTNPYDCYVETSCSFLNCDGPNPTGDFECVFGVDYYAKPSSVSSSEAWIFEISLQDDEGKIESTTGTIQLNELVAIQVSSTIEYGSLAIASTSTEKSLFIRNTGNTAVDVLVSGVELSCQNMAAVPTHRQRYSVTEGLDYEIMIPLSSTAATASLQLSPQTSSVLISTTSLYWKLAIADSGIPAGNCTGTTNINAVETP